MPPHQSRPVRVAQFGLGPIGVESLRLLATRPWAQVVGGVDVDPAKQGKDLAELCDTSALKGGKVYRSFVELMAEQSPDVVLHTAGSALEASITQILEMVDAGVWVATTCEPMLYPWLTAPRSAEKLDAAARAQGVGVVGTGVNPGFVMDLLPILATGVLRRVDRIAVERVVDASTRRGPLQKKIGSGMEPAKFKGLYEQGKAGHAGFGESAALIASAMGWAVDPGAITQTLEPVLAEHPIQTQHFTVQPGQTRGLHQVVTVTHDNREVIRLDLTMALGESEPHDTIQITGDPDLTLNIPGGVPGDGATVAALVNCVPRLLASAPGLRKMTDLPAPVHAPLHAELQAQPV